jgi:hypothetical protein
MGPRGSRRARWDEQIAKRSRFCWFGLSFSILFLAAGAVGAVGNAQLHRRSPSPVGRRGFIAAFHRTSASIARSFSVAPRFGR